MHKRLYFVVAIALFASFIAPAASAQDDPPTRHHPVNVGDTVVQPTDHLLAPINGKVSVVVHLDKVRLVATVTQHVHAPLKAGRVEQIADHQRQPGSPALVHEVGCHPRQIGHRALTGQPFQELQQREDLLFATR